MKLIDTHCHLNFKAFKKDLATVIENANKAGVQKIIVPGAKLHSSNLGCEIAGKFENVFAAVGIHPHHALENIDVSQLRSLAGNSQTVAIGEIGLDHHQYKDYPELTADDKNKQVILFEEQLKIALEFKKPVIIHCREAQQLLMATISKFVSENGKINGVFHCFEGNNEFLNFALVNGFYIGFDGNITYPENNKLREILSSVPLERLLLETDAPFLTPQNYRGSRNEPAHIIETLKFISGRLNIDVEKLAGITSKNAEKLFFS